MSRCGVVLAAGRGTRLAPLAVDRPKASFPIGQQTMLRRAVDVLRPHTDEIAVNYCGFPDWFRANVPPGIRQFEEGPEPYGTAGAIVNMRSWVGGRDVLVLNADAVHFGDVSDFVRHPSDRPTRLLVAIDRDRPDFDGLWRFTGLSMMSHASVDALSRDATDLYQDLWRHQLAGGELDLFPFAGLAIDCGTPLDLLAANLVATSGASLVEDGASVAGTVESCVVLSGAEVQRGEVLRYCIAGPAGRVASTPDPAPKKPGSSWSS